LPAWITLAAWVVGLGVVLLVYVLRLDHVCGLFVDDAWYVMLAKALASGQGYELLNAPSRGIVPFYPPGHPGLLALAWWLVPSFPDNVWLLKSVSIAAMLGVAVVTRRYAERDLGLSAPLAVALGLATVLQGGFVFLATSTAMSECVFTAAQLLAVLLVERVARGRGGAGTAAAAGALAGYAFLVRSMALGLIGAAGLYLLLQRRWRAVVAFTLGAVAVAAPWVLYAVAHAATPAQQLEVNDYVVYPYSTHFWMNTAGHPARGFATAAELPMRVWGQARTIARVIVGGVEVYPLYRTIEVGAWSEITTTLLALSFALTGLALVGFVAAVRRRLGLAEILTPVSLLIVSLWSFTPFRFVLPLTPFLLYYSLLGLMALVRLVTRRDGGATALAALGLVIALDLGSHVNYVRHLYGPPDERPLWVRIFDEELELMRWVPSNVSPGQPVAAINPAMTYLYTGYQAVGYWTPLGTWGEWRRLGIHYMVDVSYPDKNGNLVVQRFPAVYSTKKLGLQILDLQRIYQPH
jgi:hypothetical protein